MRVTASEEYHVPSVSSKTAGLLPGDPRWLQDDNGNPYETVCELRALGYLGKSSRTLRRYVGKHEVRLVPGPHSTRRYDVESLMAQRERQLFYTRSLNDRVRRLQLVRRIASMVLAGNAAGAFEQLWFANDFGYRLETLMKDVRRVVQPEFLRRAMAEMKTQCGAEEV